MKKLYYLLFVLSSLAIQAQTGTSQEVGTVRGALTVTDNGAAAYSIPIEAPPGINGVVPEVSITYNSQAQNGLAGYGWNIGGISSISRIPSTQFHDGVIDPVDFDNLDRFALDGQRLMLKSGTYGGSSAEYQTENFSNIKITSHGVSPYGANYGPAYFIVEYADGSKAYFGSTTNSRSRKEWGITYWENPQGVRIKYFYSTSDEVMKISSINYGQVGSGSGMNVISFQYKLRQRMEHAYIGNVVFRNTSVLGEVRVLTNGVGYRSYILSHTTSDLGYDILTSVTEKSGDNTKIYNPTVFGYDTTSTTLTYGTPTTLSGVSSVNSLNTGNVTGDFDGDGKLDYMLFNVAMMQDTYYPNDVVLKPSSTSYRMFLSSDNAIEFTHNVQSNYETILPGTILTGTESSGYKLSPKQGWTVVKQESTQVRLTTYLTSPSTGFVPQYEKVLPNDLIGGLGARHYYSGDFDGDGLMDVIIVVKATGQTHFLKNDKRLPLLNSYFFANYIAEGIAKEDQVYTGDFNGDGKTDLFHFKNDRVRIYTLNASNQISLLAERTNDSYISRDRPILMGDYNGDGKTDFIIPFDHGGSYTHNFAKFLSSGTEVVRTLETYEAQYVKDQTQAKRRLIANDMNNDGKTDLVNILTWRNDNNPGGQGYGQGYISVQIHKNTGTNFVEDGLFATTALQANIKANPMMLFLTSDRPNKNLELAFLSNNQVHHFRSYKDFNQERLLKTVTDGNGVVDKVTYSYLTPTCDTPGCMPAYYISETQLNYPYFDVAEGTGFNVVSLLEKQGTAQYRKKQFRYLGGVLNYDGLGFMGFKGIMSTNWHTSNQQVISTLSKRDISKRGAEFEHYTVQGWPVMNSTYSPTVFIEKTLRTYEDVLFANKVYRIRNATSITYNGLENTSKGTTSYYDEYNNPTAVYVQDKLGTTLQRAHSTLFEYDNQPSGSTYYIGRLTKKSTETYVDAGVMTSEEVYVYTNHLVTQIKKKGHNTDYVVEDNEYDAFGNIIEKTVSATGLTPRVTSYEYDTTGRFLTKSTDSEGLATLYTYNNNTGLLTSEENPYGQVTQYFYDVWGKTTKVTDHLGKNKYIAYTRLPAGEYRINTTGDNGSETISVFDALGRETITGRKMVDGTISYTETQYDIYDRKTSVSDPYSGTGGATQYTTTEYDIYGRITKIVSPAGKVTNFTYNGLTVTADDGVNAVITTKNSLGNIVSVTDNGGTITYQYYSNNSLKQSNYGGSVTTVEQDGWGRNTKIVDSSSGTYTYEYNGYGQITKETNPKGSINYVYSNSGILYDKWFSDGTTFGTMSYWYDYNTKLLWSTGFQTEDYSHNLEYTFDSQNRITEVLEETIYWLPVENKITYKKTYTYDSFGRIDTETSYAMCEGQTSTLTVKNWYKNGYLWKITDVATAEVLWQVDTVNDRGQATASKYGGIDVINRYDTYGFPEEIKYSMNMFGSNVELLRHRTTFDAQSGNLMGRSYLSNVVNKVESFQYDDLDRLTHYTDASGQQVQQAYDNRGRITQNTLGQFEYANTAKKYQQTGLELTEAGKAHYYNREGIYNAGMEDRNEMLVYSDPANLTYDTAKAYSGTYSLKINNTTGTEKTIGSSKKVNISNAAATDYTVSGWVYSNGPAAQLHMVMTATGSTTSDFAQTTATGEWTFISKVISVPANVKTLSVRLDSESNGVVWFDDIRIVKTSDATTARELNITYDMFGNPVEITETGVDRITFNYGDEGMRLSMFSGSMDEDKLERPYRKYYSSYIKNIEIKHNTVTNEVEFITFVGGDAYSAPVAYRKKGTSGSYLYLFRDYQGSILHIANAGGSMLESRVYDAWGNIVQVLSGTGTPLLGLSILDRGYTGHEHLATVGLIHMNGRVYDPELHRFLQPDSYIQDPYNTQNYNKYGYVMNNPCKYTDPSGEFWHIVIGAVIGGGLEWIKGGDFGDILKGAAAGAIGAFVGGGIANIAAGGSFFGSAASSISGFWQGASIGMLSGGVGAYAEGATREWLDGGNFWDGLNAGLTSVPMGIVTGGISRGAMSGAKALFNGANFFTGNETVDLSETHGARFNFTKLNGKIKVKYVGRFEGIKVYESPVGMGSSTTSAGLTLPPNKIIVAKGAFANLGSNEYINDLFKHEFGHILQFRVDYVGYRGFYSVIAPESLNSASFNSDQHSFFWTETWANYLSSNYFQQEFHYRELFPIIDISPENRAKFDKWWIKLFR